MNDRQIASFLAACKRDNKLFMTGKLTHEQYWTRVHARDAQVKAMSPEDRRKVNGWGR
jgi:SHS2 domain-containing protein